MSRQEFYNPYARVGSPPTTLLERMGNCGPVSIWLALKSLGERISGQDALAICRFRENLPTFMITMATELKRRGLKVLFRTDCDPAPQPFEIRAYKTASKLKLNIEPALPLSRLLNEADNDARVIIALGDTEFGHFSPVIKCGRGRATLVYDYSEWKNSPFRKIEDRRCHPGICRQSITIWRR